jgi:hypothetical protein
MTLRSYPFTILIFETFPTTISQVKSYLSLQFSFLWIYATVLYARSSFSRKLQSKRIGDKHVQLRSDFLIETKLYLKYDGR